MNELPQPTIHQERRLELGKDWQRDASGLYLPPEPKPARGADLLAIDLFCGAGGFSLGFHEAGWHVAAAVEWDVWAAMTYLVNLGGPDTAVHFLDHDAKVRWNKALATDAKRKKREQLPNYAPGSGWISHHPEQKPVEHFYLGDIRKLSAQQLMDDLNIRVGEAGCVLGGPPCQGYSMSGKRETMDPRNSLVFEFMHFVVAVKPMTFIMENVPGLLTMVTPEGVPVTDMLARIAQDGNFMTADAFKRTLAAQADSIGFLRGDTKPTKTATSEPPADAGEQLNLLAV